MSILQEDRFVGCLLGTAVGDALGQPVEAFPPERLRREFGEIRFLKNLDDFERAVIDVVMGGNDADTTAAIAGAISGAFNGVAAIPARWRENVERGREIEALARDLWQTAERTS